MNMWRSLVWSCKFTNVSLILQWVVMYIGPTVSQLVVRVQIVIYKTISLVSLIRHWQEQKWVGLVFLEREQRRRNSLNSAAKSKITHVGIFFHIFRLSDVWVKGCRVLCENMNNCFQRMGTRHLHSWEESAFNVFVWTIEWRNQKNPWFSFTHFINTF